MDNPTDFYDALAPMFDVMTDWDARLAAEGPFLQSVLEEAGRRRVLDAACGSGGHALWLARLGYDVAGADVSPVMIALARQKAAAAGFDVPFAVERSGESQIQRTSNLPSLRRRPLPGQLAAAPADPGPTSWRRCGGWPACCGRAACSSCRTSTTICAGRSSRAGSWRKAACSTDRRCWCGASPTTTYPPGASRFTSRLFRKDGAQLAGRGSHDAPAAALPGRPARRAGRGRLRAEAIAPTAGWRCRSSRSIRAVQAIWWSWRRKA